MTTYAELLLDNVLQQINIIKVIATLMLEKQMGQADRHQSTELHSML